MITIKRNELTKVVYYKPESGKMCLLGHIFHRNGVTFETLDNGSAGLVRKELTDQRLKELFFRLTTDGFVMNSPLSNEVTERNDDGEVEEAVALLREKGIEVELVD